MATVTRQITGPIENAAHIVVPAGTLDVILLHPINDGDVLILPFKLKYPVVDGALPDDCVLTAPGKYEFRLFDMLGEKVWAFHADLQMDDGSPISVSELWVLSGLGDSVDAGFDLGSVDAATLGSNGATSGYVLTADGSGASFWGEPADGGGAVLDAYLRNDIDDETTTVYIGYTQTSTGTAWVIKRMEFTGPDVEERYSTGTSGYATNWTNRAGLTYQRAEDVVVH